MTSAWVQQLLCKSPSSLQEVVGSHFTFPKTKQHTVLIIYRNEL